MEPVDQLAVIVPALQDLVDKLHHVHLTAATPCEKFDVHGVLDHMIVLGGAFSYWFRGESAPDLQPPAVYGWVPAKEFRVVMDDLLDAVRSPGAMDRTIVAPVGEMPGETFARLVAFDGLVHGWDIARAAGLPYDVPEDVVAVVDEFARAAITPAMRDGDTFKDPTEPPTGATRLERLVAFSGRTV